MYVANDLLNQSVFRCMKETDKLRREFLKKLGQRIKEIRLEKNLSQSELANLCGKDRQSYQRVESGNINPTIWYLQHIAVALDVELRDILNVDLSKPNL